MISIEEAQQLMIEFIRLRQKVEESKSYDDELLFRKHEQVCIKKFKYLVTMKTNKYKQFSNYEDLNQEGLEALIKSMKNYDPKKGNFFWWSLHYINTRISRSANLHTTIRYPLKIAKQCAPHKEAVMPLIIEHRYCPDKEAESSQSIGIIKETLPLLSEEQKQIVSLAYGLDGDKPKSINKICKELKISRANCIKAIKSSISIMRENIKI